MKPVDRGWDQVNTFATAISRALGVLTRHETRLLGLGPSWR